LIAQNEIRDLEEKAWMEKKKKAKKFYLKLARNVNYHSCKKLFEAV
jgi:hypothetical protein